MINSENSKEDSQNEEFLKKTQALYKAQRDIAIAEDVMDSVKSKFPIDEIKKRAEQEQKKKKIRIAFVSIAFLTILIVTYFLLIHSDNNEPEKQATETPIEYTNIDWIIFSKIKNIQSFLDSSEKYYKDLKYPVKVTIFDKDYPNGKEFKVNDKNIYKDYLDIHISKASKLDFNEVLRFFSLMSNRNSDIRKETWLIGMYVHFIEAYKRGNETFFSKPLLNKLALDTSHSIRLFYESEDKKLSNALKKVFQIYGIKYTSINY
jgi:hypothetical protein